MLHFPGDFGCFDMQTCSVDKHSTICVKEIHYSVPDTFVGQTIVVQIYNERLRNYDAAHKKVAEHERSYDKGTWHFDINHYLDTLIRKPEALKGAMTLKQMLHKIQELFHAYYADNGIDFLALLKYCQLKGHGYDDILKAMRMIRMRRARHVNTDQIKVAFETMDE